MVFYFGFKSILGQLNRTLLDADKIVSNNKTTYFAP